MKASGASIWEDLWPGLKEICKIQRENSPANVWLSSFLAGIDERLDYDPPRSETTRGTFERGIRNFASLFFVLALLSGCKAPRRSRRTQSMAEKNKKRRARPGGGPREEVGLSICVDYVGLIHSEQLLTCSPAFRYFY